MSKRIDMTGQVFERLTAVECVGMKHNQAMWLCQCSCGNTTIVMRQHLINGHTASCGCLRKELMSERNRILWDYKRRIDKLEGAE